LFLIFVTHYCCYFLFTALFAPYCIFKILFSYSAIQPQVCLINSVQLVNSMVHCNFRSLILTFRHLWSPWHIGIVAVVYFLFNPCVRRLR